MSSDKYSTDGRIVNIANGDLGNAVTSHTYIPFNLEGYLYGVFELDIQNTTVTLHGSNDNATIADADARFVDISQTRFGAPNFTSDTDLEIDTPLPYGRLRITRVTSNATNSFALRLGKSG